MKEIKKIPISIFRMTAAILLAMGISEYALGYTFTLDAVVMAYIVCMFEGDVPERAMWNVRRFLIQYGPMVLGVIIAIIIPYRPLSVALAVGLCLYVPYKFREKISVLTVTMTSWLAMEYSTLESGYIAFLGDGVIAYFMAISLCIITSRVIFSKWYGKSVHEGMKEVFTLQVEFYRQLRKTNRQVEAKCTHQDLQIVRTKLTALSKDLAYYKGKWISIDYKYRKNMDDYEKFYNMTQGLQRVIECMAREVEIREEVGGTIDHLVNAHGQQITKFYDEDSFVYEYYGLRIKVESVSELWLISAIYDYDQVVNGHKEEISLEEKSLCAI